MSTSSGGTNYVEASAPLGMVLVAMGGAIIAVHAVFSIFTGWTWAIIFGSLWVLLGALLLFPDVRLYQYDQSPLEQVLLEYEEQ